MHRHTYTQMYVQCTVYVQYIQMHCTHIIIHKYVHTRQRSVNRIIVDFDTIVILFMRAKSVLTIEIIGLYPCTTALPEVLHSYYVT